MSLSAPIRSLYASALTRRLLRVAGWLAVGFYFAGGLVLLTLRYAVLPQISQYRGDVETALSRSLKLPVSIGALDAGWSGLRPRLVIRDLAIRDAAGRAALGFEHVEAELAWSSILHAGPHLHRLEIAAPDLDIRRDAEGRYFVAGLEVTPSSSGSGFAEWLLAQDRIVVRDATVRWQDDLRGAPALALRRLNFDLHNDGRHHRFGITAEPPAQLAARLDVRGDFRGEATAPIATWQGDAYAELDYADLAVWRNWVDYPVELPRGSGGLRLWVSFAQQQLTGVTADLRLAGVSVRLAPELPMLELARLEGRLAAKRLPDGFEAMSRQLTLATHDGIAIEPADLRLRLREATTGRAGSGELDANGLDLGALTALAAYLPLAQPTRERIAAYAPRGRLRGFRLSWTGSPGDLRSWHAAGNFADLGLAASKDWPAGFAGVSGSVDGDDKAGRLILDARQAAIELPTLFADPKIGLATLNAQLNWKASADGIEVEIVRSSFANQDASGEAAGRYRWQRGAGPGHIDLSAKLTQAAGTAVWRYMPLVVAREARDWLRAALQGGVADEATLRLKGDLAKFPFEGGAQEGVFEVKAQVRAATLRYAPGWPEIRNIDGSLLFEGARMLIQAHKGDISGTAVGPVKVEIADLGAADRLLAIEGRAAGATADFLAFIEASPVGTRIDHFTEDMTAQGNGELQLALAMPLRRIADTKIDGRFRFFNNRLVPDPDMPPLTNVTGELRFNGNRLDAQRIQAAMFGMPLTVDIATAGDGSVGVKAAGSVTVAGLRQQFGHPLLDHLSGAAPWSGTLKVRKKNVDLRIESSLQGIASSLPEPFNKRTNTALPLVVERRQGTAAGRDTVNVTAGDVLKATLMRRHETTGTVVERGVIAVGAAAPKLPDRGLLLAAQARRIDADLWRRLGQRGSGGASPVTAVDVRADEFVAYGRNINGLRLAATQGDHAWKADIRSAEIAGNVEWDGRGAGRISGRLARFVLPEAAGEATEATEHMPDELPAIDLTIDRFAAGGKEFGILRIRAGTEPDGYWNAKFDIKNDEATFEGNGRWRPKTNPPETKLEFKLTTKSIEKTLVRLGYPDAVRRGTANCEGTLSWKGAPLHIDYPSLSGRLKFQAAGGQFNKLEPGVGRLLGVLSLQSLPRRLTLDFRDVFSEGFAFDGIAGDANVAHGVMATDNLQIAGPAARILMTGSVDLAAETQSMKVRVQPAIGETLATGVLIAHPVAGAAAWVFNKLFGNPFDQAFAYEYAVSGTWADPKVEKLAGPSQGTTENRKEKGNQ